MIICDIDFRNREKIFVCTVNRLFVAASLIKAAPRLQRNLQTTFLEVLVQDLSIIKAAARLYQQIPTPKLSCSYREPPFYSLASRDRYRSCDNISFALQFTDVLRFFLKFI